MPNTRSPRHNPETACSGTVSAFTLCQLADPSRGRRIVNAQLMATIVASRAIHLLLLLSLLASGSARAGGVPTAGGDPVSAWVQLALEANPDLEAISLQVRALEAAAEGSRRWMDPMVSVEYSNVPWRAPTLGNSPMSGLQLRVQQNLPIPGINDAREAVAKAQVDVQSAALTEARSRLAASVRIAYWRLAHTRAQKEVTVRHVALVDELRSAVEGRYAAGYADQGALLRLALLRDRLQDGLDDFDRDARVLVAGLNGAMARAPGEVVETPPLQAALAPPGGDLEALIEESVAQRGELERYRADATVARKQSELATRQRFPEVNVWAGYRVRAAGLADGGADFLSIGVGAPLPFDYTGRWDAERRSAELRAKAAEQRYENALNLLSSDLSSALATWTRAFERAETYQDDLLPLGQSALESTMASFQTGRADFESLYQAELALLELERAILRARMETYVQDATVASLVGSAE